MAIKTLYICDSLHGTEPYTLGMPVNKFGCQVHMHRIETIFWPTANNPDWFKVELEGDRRFYVNKDHVEAVFDCDNI